MVLDQGVSQEPEQDVNLPPEEQQPPHRIMGLCRNDQLVLGVLILLALILSVVPWVRLSHWGVDPIEIERLPAKQFEFQFDINDATWVEWAQLPGIGETLAHRIVVDREQNGRFETIEALKRVKGIGPKTVEKLRPWLRVTEPVQPQQAITRDAALSPELQQ
jgi:competence protein ComEA